MYLRRVLYSSEDKLNSSLVSYMQSDYMISKGVIQHDMGDYLLYTYPKSKPIALIRFFEEGSGFYESSAIKIFEGGAFTDLKDATLESLLNNGFSELKGIKKGYSHVDLIKDSNILNNRYHEEYFVAFIKLLTKVSKSEVNFESNDGYEDIELSSKMLSSINRSSNRPTSRITFKFNNSSSKISIGISRTLTICMHESAAYLCMLSDFDTILKDLVDTVGRYYVTRQKPLLFDFSVSKVHFRDTMLLSPVGAKSLAALGEIYGDVYKKVDIGVFRKGKMRELKRVDPEKFIIYGLTDSLITLKHATSMEEFNLTVNKVGVPLTLSGIGKSYVLKE